MTLFEQLKTACYYHTLGTIYPNRISQKSLLTKNGGLCEKQYLYGEAVINIAHKFSEYVAVNSSYPADMAQLQVWSDGYNATDTIKMCELSYADDNCAAQTINVDFVNIGVDAYVIYTTPAADLPTYYCILTFSGSTLSGVSLNQSIALNEPIPPGYASPYTGYNVLDFNNYVNWQLVYTEDCGTGDALIPNINCFCKDYAITTVIDCLVNNIGSLNLGFSILGMELHALEQYAERIGQPACPFGEPPELCLIEKVCGYKIYVYHSRLSPNIEYGNALIIEVYCKQQRRSFFFIKTIFGSNLYASQIPFVSTISEVSEIRCANSNLVNPYQTRVGYPNVSLTAYTDAMAAADCAQDAINNITPVVDFICCENINEPDDVCRPFTYSRPIVEGDPLIFFASYDSSCGFTPSVNDNVFLSGTDYAPAHAVGKVTWVDSINGLLAIDIPAIDFDNRAYLSCGNVMYLRIFGTETGCMVSNICFKNTCNPCQGSIIEFTNNGSYAGYPYGVHNITQKFRMLVELINPFNDVQDSIDKTSTGITRKLSSYARRGYTLQTGYLPERDMEIIEKMLQHDSIRIYQGNKWYNIVCEGGMNWERPDKFYKSRGTAKVYIVDSGVFNDFC